MRKVRATRQKVEISMTNLLFAILIGVGGGTSAVGIVPQAPTQPVIETPCHEDEVGMVMRYDFRPASDQRGYWDGDRFYRLCIPLDDYDESLIDAYLDSH